MDKSRDTRVSDTTLVRQARGGSAKSYSKLLGGMMCALFATGCVTNPSNGGPGGAPAPRSNAAVDPCSNTSRNVGILLGGIAGAVIGNQMKHSDASRIIGATVGATLGGLIGAEMDKRRCELHKIAKRNNIEMQFEDIKLPPPPPTRPVMGAPAAPTAAAPESAGMKVTLKDNGRQFESGTDRLNPEAAAYFQQIADQYSYEVQRRLLPPNATKEDVDRLEALRNKRILLVGHTDDTGNSRLNADLSERRAQAVARIFRSRGISDDRIFYQGAGETLPVADNRTVEGQARNRRVEIIDLSDDNAMHAYLASRKPVLSYYRTTPAARPAEAAGRSNDAPAVAADTPAPRAAKASAKEAAPKAGTTESAPKVAAAESTPKATERKSAARTPAPANDSKQAAGSASAPSPVASGAGSRDSTSKTAPAAATAGTPSFDFGGEPVGAKIAAVDIGKQPAQGGAFSFISTAQADEPITGACTQDRPRVGHGVKSLRDNQEIQAQTRDYMPGLYNSSWTGMVNGHLVALTNVAVLRDGGVPARRPQLLLYPNFQGDSKAKAAYSASPEVNSYQGDKGVLYRVFVNGPMQCMDIIVPKEKPTEAAVGSRLFYNRGRELYVASYLPKLAR